jgi:hypothetical protein
MYGGDALSPGHGRRSRNTRMVHGTGLHAGIRSSGPMVSYCGDDKKGPIAEVLEFFGQIEGPYLR